MNDSVRSRSRPFRTLSRRDCILGLMLSIRASRFTERLQSRRRPSDANSALGLLCSSSEDSPQDRSDLVPSSRGPSQSQSSLALCTHPNGSFFTPCFSNSKSSGPLKATSSPPGWPGDTLSCCLQNNLGDTWGLQDLAPRLDVSCPRREDRNLSLSQDP